MLSVIGEKRPCALVLGAFDGLHLGHRTLLEAAKGSGFPVALSTMFGGKGKALFTREERRKIFAAAGVEILLEIDLDEALLSTPAEEFLRRVFSLLDVSALFVGEDFRFGKGALGTPELLIKKAKCPVHVLKTAGCMVGGEPVKISTSLCKDLLLKGDFSALNALLCPKGENFFSSAYFSEGEVEHGRAVGRTYGFPTLNLREKRGKLLPRDGVYGGITKTPKGNFPSIINIGARPTFGVEERTVEVYLDGFSGDLYGETVCVFPTEYYRAIQKFPSKEELKNQLTADVSRLRGKGEHQ